MINGDWKISIPGEYSVAGTKLLYRRSADTWESFEVPGPTREDLHLMVRSQQDRVSAGSSTFGPGCNSFQQRSAESVTAVTLLTAVSLRRPPTSSFSSTLDRFQPLLRGSWSEPAQLPAPAVLLVS